MLSICTLDLQCVTTVSHDDEVNVSFITHMIHNSFVGEKYLVLFHVYVSDCVELRLS